MLLFFVQVAWCREGLRRLADVLASSSRLAFVDVSVLRIRFVRSIECCSLQESLRMRSQNDLALLVVAGPLQRCFPAGFLQAMVQPLLSDPALLTRVRALRLTVMKLSLRADLF